MYTPLRGKVVEKSNYILRHLFITYVTNYLFLHDIAIMLLSNCKNVSYLLL